MRREVIEFIHRNKLLFKGATVLVGVSGGPDSMALLHYLYSIRQQWNLHIIALSVDHQLRGDASKEDLYYVKQICEQWNIQFEGVSVDVPAYKKENRYGTRLAARELRYQFFEEQMEKYNADFLALAHHGDDQVETMLMSLVRTASSSTFSGMPTKRIFASGYIIRPFLCITKHDILQYCEQHQIIPRIDASNEETTYTRNYFRKYILPLLKDKNVNIHAIIQHLHETLSEDEVYLQKEAYKMVENVVDMKRDKKIVSFKIDDFTAYPTALQRRAYHLILNYLYNKLPKDLSYVQEEYFFSLLKNANGNMIIDFPQGLKVEKVYQRVEFYYKKERPQQIPPFHVLLDIPGKIKLPDGSVITADFTNHIEKQNIYTYICSTNDVILPLHVRTRQSGDRMSWQGLNGSKKIKDIFIDAKVPVKRRDTWPIVTDSQGEIHWLIGLKKKTLVDNGKNTPYIQLIYEQAK